MAPPVRSLQELITDNELAPDENGAKNAKDLQTLAHVFFLPRCTLAIVRHTNSLEAPVPT